MATARVTHGIDDLASDMAGITKRVKPEGRKVVRKNVREGRTLARKLARELSGDLHGKTYFKRITDEMTDDLQGEYGPNDGGTPVGGGWRNGTPNTELERSLDVTGPKFEKAVGDMVDGWFW